MERPACWRRRAASLAVAGALACSGALCTQALAPSGDSALPQAYAAGKAAKNAKAHAAYKKKLAKLKAENGFASYKFIDLTGDGVDEMVLSWWPSVYTYKGGKAKRVHSGSVGSHYYTKAYKSKRVVVYSGSDHMGSAPSKVYLKWNGKKFKEVATLYTAGASARAQGASSYYWVKGKGEVTKKRAQAYVKRLLGKAKATKIKFKSY